VRKGCAFPKFRSIPGSLVPAAEHDWFFRCANQWDPSITAAIAASKAAVGCTLAGLVMFETGIQRFVAQLSLVIPELKVTPLCDPCSREAPVEG
jgi:hypothetical protein